MKAPPPLLVLLPPGADPTAAAAVMLQDNDATMERVADRGNAIEMANQPFYRFLAKTYVWHIVASAVALYAFGGLPAFLWGFCFRTAWRALLPALRRLLLGLRCSCAAQAPPRRRGA